MDLQWNHKHKISDALGKHAMGYLVIFGFYSWLNQSTRERKMPKHCKKQSPFVKKKIMILCS